MNTQETKTEAPKHPTINLAPVKSSQIEAVGHDAATNTLAIQFKGRGDKPGSVYHYANVTPEQHKAMVGAESVGSHFYKNIKPKTKEHPYTKVS